MMLLDIDEVKVLLSEESDVLISDVGNNGIVQLEHAPLDLPGDLIYISDNKYYIEVEALLKYITDEIFLSPVEFSYDENGYPKYLIVKS